MIAYSLVFLLRYLGFFGQLDQFILQWEEVLCSGFDLMVLDPSDRRGTDTSIVASKDKTMGLSLHR